MPMPGTEGTVAVMGAGAWGTALAKVLADGGSQVRLWARRSGIADQINQNRHNPDYLPGVALPDGIRRLRFRLRWHGLRLTVDATHTDIT